MGTGTLIAESLRTGSELRALHLLVTRIHRADLGDEETGQPRTWTLIDFDFPDEAAEDLGAQLAASLIKPFGWYCDLHTADDTYVVFADQVFRYARGTDQGRAEAASYAREMGVPEEQIDWPA